MSQLENEAKRLERMHRYLTIATIVLVLAIVLLLVVDFA